MDRNTIRLRRADLEKDIYAISALQGISNYAPSRTELSTQNLLAVYSTMQDAERTEVQKEGEYKAARDHAVLSEHEFHNAILDAKDQVRAQFGADSDEYQSLGLKKRSERKPPRRKTE